MAERKATNKYYPPDFDPSKLPPRRRPKNRQETVRMMLPMRVRCATCGEHLAPGTKFNSRKEDVTDERYLGAIPIFRFYIRCTRFSAEITFKTDPKNSGYAVESGGFEPRRGGAATEDNDEAVAKRAREGEDAMGAMERRARDAKREMAVDAAQEEMRSLRSRHARVTPEQLLKSLSHHRVADDRRALQELEEEDEKLISATKFRSSKDFVARIEEEEEEEDFFEACMARSKTTEASCQARSKKQRQAAPVVSPEGCTGTTLEAKGKAHIDKAKDALQLVCCSYNDDDSD